MYVEPFICTEFIACVFVKVASFSVILVKRGPGDMLGERASSNGTMAVPFMLCPVFPTRSLAAVVGSEGPNGDWAAASCTLYSNGERNGIGESNANVNTIMAYM